MTPTNKSTSSEKVIGVLIVDDHQVVSAGLSTWLSTAPDIKVLGICDRPEQVMTAIDALAPDVVLLDLRFDNSPLNGVDLLGPIHGLAQRPRILAVSAYYDVPQVLATLKAGVDGYILKTTADIGVIQAIRVVNSGQQLFDPQISKVVQGYLPEQDLPASFDSATANLTAREWDVLRLIAQTYSNQEIADELVLSPQTVKRHVTNILSKLGLEDRNQAAVWCRMNDTQTKYTAPLA